jgi:hypothetical protein
MRFERSRDGRVRGKRYWRRLRTDMSWAMRCWNEPASLSSRVPPSSRVRRLFKLLDSNVRAFVGLEIIALTALNGQPITQLVAEFDTELARPRLRMARAPGGDGAKLSSEMCLRTRTIHKYRST